MLANPVVPWPDAFKFKQPFAYSSFAFVCANTAWYIVPARLGLAAASDLMAKEAARRS
jgi:hypothetical protein